MRSFSSMLRSEPLVESKASEEAPISPRPARQAQFSCEWLKLLDCGQMGCRFEAKVVILMPSPGSEDADNGSLAGFRILLNRVPKRVRTVEK